MWDGDLQDRICERGNAGVSFFMKPGTRRALDKMAAATRPKCEQCPSVLGKMPVTRCCDKFFCQVTEVTIRELGENPEGFRGEDAELPFMGEEGCRVPPHLRPVCTGFVCQHHLKSDPGFASKWEALQKKLSSDPNLVRAVSIAREEIGGLPAAITRYRDNHLVPVDPDSGKPVPPEEPPPEAA